jgi:hypothetical protein
MTPELQRLHAENQRLQGMAQRAQTSAIQAALDRDVPGWKERIFADPAFSTWLESPDPYNDGTRSQLLRRAVANGDADRVVRFYRGFLAEHAPAGQQRAAQSRQTSAGGNIYTRAQIASLYDRRRKGEISDTDWARWEADIFAASRQGRIVGALNLSDGTQMSRLR